MDEKKLAIFTPRQREAVLLKDRGLTIKKIAEEMGVSYSAARQLLHSAERRLREYERFQKVEEEDKVISAVPISRGECKVMLDALEALEREYEGNVAHRASSDWIGRLPYESKVVANLYERLQLVVYGHVVRQLPPNWEI